MAPPTTHQYIPSAGPPEEEKKDDVDNVNYFLSNLMMGQGTPGSFPMPAAPEKKPEDEKVQFMPPFIPMPMQAPPPEKEPKDKKKTSQPLPFMPPYNSGGPGPAFIAPPPGFAYPFPAPWFYGGVPAPYYPMPIYCYPVLSTFMMLFLFSIHAVLLSFLLLCLILAWPFFVLSSTSTNTNEVYNSGSGARCRTTSYARSGYDASSYAAASRNIPADSAYARSSSVHGRYS